VPSHSVAQLAFQGNSVMQLVFPGNSVVQLALAGNSVARLDLSARLRNAVSSDIFDICVRPRVGVRLLIGRNRKYDKYS
jgi:hypothetical protein